MPEKIRIPFNAKKSAIDGLRERESNKAGLTKTEAQKLGIYSGVERAKQLIDRIFIDEKNAKQVARFYLRFRNCKTKRCETAIKLWGGRRFGRMLANKYYKKN
jgi:hypothetical protein